MPEARGVWMSRDVILGGPARMEQVFYRLAGAHFNRVFVDVHYKGATIYPSTVVAAAGGPEQREEFAGRDPLLEAIDIGHRFGLEVVAWFEYGLMAHTNPTDSTDRGPLIAAHPDWLAVRRSGSSVVANENGFFHWLDPAHPEVVHFMEDLFAEVATRYPGLDGIETDRIRYPSTEFSYSDAARSRYMAETGGSDPLLIDTRHPEWAQWSRWREHQTTNLARRIYRRVKTLRPDLLVSAAVAPPYMLLAGEKLQAWNVWADSGYVDALEPMLYLPDQDLQYQLNLCRSLVPSTFALYPGIAYQGDASLRFQLTRVRESGWKGVTIWYYGAMNEQTLQTLGQDIFAQQTYPPHTELIVDDADPIRFRCSGPWQKIQSGYAGGALQLPPGAEDAHAFWEARVLREGLYEIFAYWPAVAGASREVYYGVSTGERDISCLVDQGRNSETWVFLCADTLRHGRKVTISVRGAASGRVTADAVRLLWVRELTLDDYHVPDSVRIELKFSRAVDTSSATRADSYALEPDASVLTATLISADGAAVCLQVTPLAREQSYRLRLPGVRDRAGNPCRTQELTFSFSPERSSTLVDESATTCRLYGVWSFSQEGSGFVGQGYMVAGPGKGESRAQWWTQVMLDGLYELSVNIPNCTVELARRAPYYVLHHFGQDTVYGEQRAGRGEWLTLGRRYFRAGEFASVMLLNAVDSGMVVADACRLRRVLDTPVIKQGHSGALPVPHLLPNFPNPFNNVTTVPFVVPGAGTAQVRVFNVLGQEVDTVTTWAPSPGLHRVNLTLAQAPSGLYFCRLVYVDEAGVQVCSSNARKLVLVR
ncbi:MAG: family 10 glycosylhydrolase [candidate division KSB1 bacterium]|nr:family 10 glycosylhydrolase [candidate division KSB1 bacterium]MDZ7384854.1 family 10 glycosylhydrolase [candidate division KSB1 bacterium]